MIDQSRNKGELLSGEETALLDMESQAVRNLWLRDIFEGGPHSNPLVEIQKITATIVEEDLSPFIEKVHDDLTAIFAGNFFGFRESFVKYHDLRHTRNVALATVRLFHGLHVESRKLSFDTIKLGILCAYFHDTGMLLTKEDSAKTGAAYLKSHEDRSIGFARRYMKETAFPTFGLKNCEAIIHCTNLTTDAEALDFDSEELQLVGYVLGTADILAQMADRYYLECLPLLYHEQQDAGIQQHPSSLALMRQTTRFYHDVIEKRLQNSFHNVCRYMQTHFKEWHQLDTNLYMDFIEKNIRYLEEVVAKYDKGEGEIDEYLRRKQPKV